MREEDRLSRSGGIRGCDGLRGGPAAFGLTAAAAVLTIRANSMGAPDHAHEPGPESDTLSDANVAEAEGSVIGRYKLLQAIGEGGFGVVYMAEQTAPVVRRVALKIIKLGMDTRQVIARFEAERQALAMMDHPNIAKVLDAGATSAGRPYFVMELVRGVAIDKYCDDQKLPTEARLRLFLDVCNPVQHAHQKGIIHRDLKPTNILVTLHDGKPVPKVIDFGIAKATQSRLTDKTLFTRFEQMIGTPAYMSPEQAEMSGLEIDARSDIYSLGVLLYQLLTGQTPFDPKQLLDAGPDEMRRIIREQDPLRPSTRFSNLDAPARAEVANRQRMNSDKLGAVFRGDLDWIVMKCLEKDRTERYQSAALLIEDVDRYLRSEPVSARPPSAMYRLRKFVKRRRAPLIAAGAIGCGLIAGAVIMGGFTRREPASAVAGPQEFRAKSIEAQNLYLKGKFFFAKWTDETVKLGINYLNQAIALEPGFALAHAALAEVQITGLYTSGGAVELLPVIRRSAERALELEPQMPEAHYSMGLVNLHQRRWDDAEANFAEALKLNPDFAMAHDWRGWLLASRGRTNEAVDALRVALRLAPLSPIINPDLASMLSFAGKGQEAIQQCHETLRMDPVNFLALEVLGYCLAADGKFAESARYHEMAKSQTSNEGYRAFLDGVVAARSGRKEEALACLQKVEMDAGNRGRGFYSVACLHALLGDSKQAFEFARKSAEGFEPQICLVQVHRYWDPYRHLPEYADLLRRLNLAAKAP